MLPKTATKLSGSQCAVIIVAAGRGLRVGRVVPKQYLKIGQETIIRRTLRTFCYHPLIGTILPVIHADDRTMFEEATDDLDIMQPVIGKDTRQGSVRVGLEYLANLSTPPELVLIHDAVRPFVSKKLISSVISSLNHYSGVTPAIKIVDTVKRGNADGIIEGTEDREELWRAQTPQGFHFSEILAAHRKYALEALTDDSSVAERAGLTVALIHGDEANVKITTLNDIDTKGAQILNSETRTGQGFDAHRFGIGDSVTLCGVTIPHGQGLDGHSDSDVAMHALTDALLGAMSEDDIGTHFPSSESKFKGLNSKVFLKTAYDLLLDKGGFIINVDVTIICEEPKIKTSRQAMIGSLASILSICKNRISVKATTTDQMGFTGRGEGIAAHALATIMLP